MGWGESRLTERIGCDGMRVVSIGFVDRVCCCITRDC